MSTEKRWDLPPIQNEITLNPMSYSVPLVNLTADIWNILLLDERKLIVEYLLINHGPEPLPSGAWVVLEHDELVDISWIGLSVSGEVLRKISSTLPPRQDSLKLSRVTNSYEISQDFSPGEQTSIIVEFLAKTAIDCRSHSADVIVFFTSGATGAFEFI